MKQQRHEGMKQQRRHKEAFVFAVLRAHYVSSCLRGSGISDTGAFGDE
jgi:hypothetical protein